MITMYKLIKISFLLSALHLSTVKMSCTVEVEGDSPVFSKTIGSKTLILRNGQKSFMLKRGETLRADCPRQISIERSLHGELINGNEVLMAVNLKCDRMSNLEPDVLLYQSIDTQKYLYSSLSIPSIIIRCIQGRRQLYESNITLPNCGPHTSYVIGTKSNWRDPIIAASVCFDLNTLSVKYVKYSANRPDYEFYDNQKEQSLDTLGLSSPIEGLDILFKSSRNLGSNIQLFKNINPLLTLHEFEFLSLVQESTVSGELRHFEFMFEVIWWSNLRLGSWKYFFDALKSSSESEKYDVYTGISGAMIIPSAAECKQIDEFTFLHENREVHAPEIIWSYLRPVQSNATFEFVIIAHNTPFISAANFSHSCADICHEIDWLNGSLFHKIHLLPTFGVIECCRPSDAYLMLDGFPKDLLIRAKNTEVEKLN